MTEEEEAIARWRWVEANMNYSFDGENRWYYLKAEGRETFKETVDRHRRIKNV